MQARYNWPGGLAYGCCERKLQRRLNWLLAILLLNTKMFIFLLLLTFDLSGGQKKGNGSSSPSQRRLRSVLGFTDDPEDMAVVAVVARPVSLMWVNNLSGHHRPPSLLQNPKNLEQIQKTPGRNPKQFRKKSKSVNYVTYAPPAIK